MPPQGAKKEIRAKVLCTREADLLHTGMHCSRSAVAALGLLRASRPSVHGGPNRVSD